MSDRPQPGDQREVVQKAGFFAGLLVYEEQARTFRCPICGWSLSWWESEEGAEVPFGVELVRRTHEAVCEDCRVFMDEEMDALEERVSQRRMWNMRLAGLIPVAVRS